MGFEIVFMTQNEFNNLISDAIRAYDWGECFDDEALHDHALTYHFPDPNKDIWYYPERKKAFKVDLETNEIQLIIITND